MGDLAMENEFLIFKNDKNEASKAFLFVLILIGGLYVTLRPFLGCIICFLAVVFMFIRNGIILDVANRRYKSAVMVRNLAFAHWRPIPECKYLSVFSTTMVSSTSSLSGKYMALKNKVVKVNLIYGNNKRLTVYQSDDRADALSKARFIASSLGLKIYNADTKTWVECHCLS